MNRNNGTGIMETQRGGNPHSDRGATPLPVTPYPAMGATVVKTLRAASLQAATASRRDAMLVANNATAPEIAPRSGATPLPVTCYRLPVTVSTMFLNQNIPETGVSTMFSNRNIPETGVSTMFSNQNIPETGVSTMFSNQNIPETGVSTIFSNQNIPETLINTVFNYKSLHIINYLMLHHKNLPTC